MIVDLSGDEVLFLILFWDVAYIWEVHAACFRIKVNRARM